MGSKYKLITSPLSQKISRGGMTIGVLIYRGENDEAWLLEVVDQEGGSTIWDKAFPTDHDAFFEALRTIASRGIDWFRRDTAPVPH